MAIESFSGYKRKRRKTKRRERKPDGSVQAVQRMGQEAFRDWWSDAYRGQSGRREADVVSVI